MRVPVVLALGLALIAASVAFVLSRPPLVVAGTGGSSGRALLGYAPGDDRFCQGGETLPRGTTAVRLSLTANIGPRVTFEALAGARPITHGERPAGWGVGESVTVPVRRVASTVRDATVCTILGAALGPIKVLGGLAPARRGSAQGTPELGVEYLRPGHRSWWSLVGPIARHLGLGHAPSGAWTVALLVLLTSAVVSLVCLLVLRELGAGDGRPIGRVGRIPAAALICGLVACLSATCWSLIAPPFQLTDEPAHFAYVQQLAETGRLPTSKDSRFSPAEAVAMRHLLFLQVLWHPEHRTISSSAQERSLQHDLNRGLSRRDGGRAGVAAAQPPLYYALETIPYRLGASGTLLDQLELMRLLSAAMAGLTALFSYLFVREALPRARWTWTVGGLGVALMPLFGLMSGGVNPDALLYAVSAALFYLLARGFRRGLTGRLAVALGATLAVGFVTKLNFIGLAPGAVLGLVVLAVRARGLARRGDLPVTTLFARRVSPVGSLAIALAIGFAPVVVFVAVNVLEHRPTLGLVSSSLAISNPHESLSGELSYIWQLYLPRLPGMANYFPGISPLRQIWFNRLVGQYGWLDTTFPVWVDNLALILSAPLAVLGLRSLLAGRAALRRRLVELAVYACMSAGVMALVGADSYVHLALTSGGYVEPRYILPMLPLFGAALALCARGAGRRWGPIAGTAVVLLLVAHSLFSQLLTISRYYG
jgi:Predicted membrane protein (DUF2142)